MRLGRIRPDRGATLFAVALVAIGGCTPAEDVVDEIGVEAYSMVIAEFLPDGAVDEDEERPIVYVARLGEGTFELDDQVAMIDEVEDSHDLRFVDSIDAALDLEGGDAEPRDDGLLLGVGTVAPSEPHLVRVEVYAGSRDANAFLLTLGRSAERWRIETREPVEPEVLVGDE